MSLIDLCQQGASDSTGCHTWHAVRSSKQGPNLLLAQASNFHSVQVRHCSCTLLRKQDSAKISIASLLRSNSSWREQTMHEVAMNMIFQKCMMAMGRSQLEAMHEVLMMKGAHMNTCTAAVLLWALKTPHPEPSYRTLKP